MKATGRTFVFWLVSGIIGAGLLPIVLYWYFFLRAPGLTVDDARSLLAQTNSTAVLVDVRSPEAFAAGHAPGAVNWPGKRMAALAGPQEVPAALQGKKLLVIDDGTWRGAQAVARLRHTPGLEALNVTGGMPEWDTVLNGKPSPRQARRMSVAKQWLAVITGFVIKPAHMLLCLALIVWLWPQRAPDLAALRWGLIIFWLGEASCAENYLFFKGRCDFWEYLHNYGMSVGFAFAAYALLDGLDCRVVKYSPEKERCAALSLCRACIKYADVPCGLRRLFHLLIPASILLAIMPLCVKPEVISFNVTVLGTLTHYSHLIAAQLYETWYCSGLAIVLLIASWLVLGFKREDPVALSKILFAGAMGPLSFGLFRLFLYSVYRDDLIWAALWEEVTELLFVGSVGFVLWVFRDSLLPGRPLTPAGQPGMEAASA